MVDLNTNNACLYAMMLPNLRAAARSVGWSIGLHGSLVKDLDLIATPWTEEAVSEAEFVELMVKTSGGFGRPDGASFVDGKWVARPNPGAKPHGRRAWTICYGGAVYIDLSVVDARTMTPALARAVQALQAIEADAQRKAEEPRSGGLARGVPGGQ